MQNSSSEFTPLISDFFRIFSGLSVCLLLCCLTVTVLGCGTRLTTTDVEEDSVAMDVIDDIVLPDTEGPDSVSDSMEDSGYTDSAAGDNGDAVSSDNTGDFEIVEPAEFRLFDLSDAGDINAMWGDAGLSLWAVGVDGLVLVWRDGQFVPGPLPPVVVDFYGITGVEESMYVVGGSGTVLRLRNGVWEDISAPVDNDLYSISCPSGDECFAVGSNGVIVHLFEDEWNVQDSGVSWDLFGVLSEVNGGTYAVGRFGSLFELSGTVWISSQIAGTQSTMRSICRGPDGDLFAVGTAGAIVRLPAGSSTWQQQISNDGYEPLRDLYAVTAVTSGEVWVAGSQGAIIRYDGSYWRLSEVAGPVNTLGDFRAIAVVQGLSDVEGGQFHSVLAAGLDSAFVGFDDTWSVWVDVPAGPSSDFSGVWVPGSDKAESGADSDTAIFSGSGGLVLQFVNDRFGLVETGVETDFAAVDGGVLVGNQGTVVVLNKGGNGTGTDSVWTATKKVSSTLEDFVDVFSDDQGWLMVGSEGSVFGMDDTYVPTFFGQVPGVATSVVRTVSGIFVGGENGSLSVLAPDSGENAVFSDVVTFTMSAVRDLVPMQDGRVLAVGDNGIILVCDDKKCDRLAESSSSFLYGAGSVLTTEGISYVAVGWAGEIFVYDGNTVSPVKVDSGTWKVFTAVDGGSEGQVFVAGRGGTAAVFLSE